MSKKILFGVHGSTYFSALFGLMRMVKTYGFTPIVVFSFEYPTISRDMFALELADIKYYHNLPEYSQAFDYRIFPLVFYKEFTEGKERIQKYMEIMRSENPELVILGGDLVSYDTAHLIKAAHKRKIKALLHPSFMADYTEAAQAIFNDKSCDGNKFWNRVVSRRLPGWALQYHGKNLVRLSAGRIVARHLLHIAPPHPWLLHSGDSDEILIESGAMYDRCALEGLSQKKMQITGSIAHDQMFELMRNKDPTKKVVVTALPPDMIASRPQCDFKTYEELVRFWISSIAGISRQRGYLNIVVCLHPSVDIKSMEWLEKEYEVKISRDPTYIEIAKCSLFIASVSSVIQWAVACGVPVINYDVYRYGYVDYVAAPGVRIIEGKDQFLQSLIFPPSKPEWINIFFGKIDGKAHERLIAEINKNCMGLEV